MRGLGTRRRWLGALCALLALYVGAAPARADSSDPLFLFVPVPPLVGKPIPPPTGYLNGPCGLGVDSTGSFYVSDYHHDAVDVFSSGGTFKAQLLGVDPLDGPCGLALDGANNLYVNSYHRSVLRFAPSPSFGAGTTIAGAPLHSSHPTGVAVEAATGDVYVNQRTYVAKYEAPVEPEEEPAAEIGLGSLGDGYGLAVSAHPATKGLLYVPDAADGTVEVYDPGADLVNPVAAIDGSETPAGAFVSLRDSAVAVDRVSGEVYVVDNLQPEYATAPQARVHVFSAAGAYEGHLKHDVVTANPPGLAVDNSATSSQGRVYVTTGNTSPAGVYAYPQGAATMGAPVPATPPLASGVGAAAGEAAPALADAQVAPAPPSETGTAQASEIAQEGKLRVTVSGGFAPHALPRTGTAPLSVAVGGRISTTDGSSPPQLRGLRIEFNRRGRLEEDGLPLCRAAKIRIASTRRALRACRDSLVGQGRFEADVVLAGQAPYPTKGRLLVFNGRKGGKQVLFGHIYAARPFATSFVIDFEVGRRARGTYGTVLSASLPKALGNWGYLTAIEMKLFRRYSYRGARRSFLSAGCPAPRGFPGALFSLARARFSFAGGRTLGATLTRSCRARG